jgi:carboxylesterase type B
MQGTIMAYLYLLRRKEGIGAAFRQSAMESLHDYPEVLLLLLNHYSLSEPATEELSDDEALLNILKFISDVAFLLPAINFAERMPSSKQSYVYHFNEPNPWTGPFKGYASHILDVAFIFQNYNKDLDEKQKATAVAFASDIITFVNGQQPWKPFNSRRGVKSYLQGGGEYSEPPNESKTRRNQFILELAKDNNGPGMDGLTKVFTNFMEGN